MVLTDINAYIKPLVAVVPTAASEGTVNGAAIDRQNYESCVLLTNTGVTTGTPTSFTVNAKVQHSADGSNNWADYTDPTTVAVAAVTQITEASTQGKIGVNLLNAKRYIRVVHVLDFTGGSSPTLAISAHVILGGATKLPAV